MGSPGEAAEAGGRREAEVGCREEEAEMETRGMTRRAEEALLGLRKGKSFSENGIKGIHATWLFW